MKWLDGLAGVILLVGLQFGGARRVAADELPSLRSTSLADGTRLIDVRVRERLEAAKVPVSLVSDDAEFLRRVFLDLHGVVPTSERVRSFLSDASEDKRTRLIDELLADTRFAEHLADRWDDFLISNADNLSRTDKQRFTA